MKLPIAFRRQAQEELEEAAAWYELQSAGLGERFKDCVEEVLDRIAATPEIHGRVYEGVRCAKVRRFPFAVYYQVEPDRVVAIAVFHSSRHPREWHRRV